MPTYTDPESGAEIELDPIQADIYHDLTTKQGLHPRDAAVVAFLIDAVEPRRRRLDLSALLVNTADAVAIVKQTPGWITTAARLADKPLYRPTVEVGLATRVVRLWTAARMRYILRNQTA